MNSFILTAASFLVAAALLVGCTETRMPQEPGSQSSLSKSSEEPQGGESLSNGRIVVANRAGGSISVINTETDIATTYTLPAGDNPAEPMYVVFSPNTSRVFVGDRGNDRVVVYRSPSFEVETMIPVGDGPFHMWADDYQQQLWVVNDFDKTASVIDLSTLAVIATVPMPTDLVDMGGIPHDVILEPKGRLAYVSMNGFSGEQHYVVQFRTDTFAEENRAAVGKDPHLSLTGKDSYLYVPCQNSHVVTVLHRKTMEFVTSISVSGAHGAGMPRDGQAFYTTDFLSTGPGGLTAINTATYDVIGSVDTPVGTPHNIALTLDGQKLYITHTGSTSTSVSVFSTSSGSVPVYLKTIQVGLNPFGIAFAR